MVLRPNAGERIGLSCTSRRHGSGVRGLTVALFQDPNGPPLQTEVETATTNLWWGSAMGATSSPVVAPASGTYYLRVDNTAAPSDGVVTSRYYRCGIHVVAP